ncbi:hypothetical protein HCJ66_12130 [Listeria sp. FSL L7-1582]|uniref:hypothetical protein n=1 Tax=Listeria portnoyi TaxID=2713504 RepID=UPI00164DB265|nr:hypothetical protein [Listeria portnoyi]MBC6310287.1 hypothetical protein [Listeria portnoyi]
MKKILLIVGDIVWACLCIALLVIYILSIKNNEPILNNWGIPLLTAGVVFNWILFNRMILKKEGK